MKIDTHPVYFPDTAILCANCGQSFNIGSTKEGIRIEICSACHPFFTGKKVLIDTEGRVDKFRQRIAGATGRDKKVRKKKTLEERVNEEIAVQLSTEKKKESKAKFKKTPAKSAEKEAV